MKFDQNPTVAKEVDEKTAQTKKKTYLSLQGKIIWGEGQNKFLEKIASLFSWLRPCVCIKFV